MPRQKPKEKNQFGANKLKELQKKEKITNEQLAEIIDKSKDQVVNYRAAISAIPENVRHTLIKKYGLPATYFDRPQTEEEKISNNLKHVLKDAKKRALLSALRGPYEPGNDLYKVRKSYEEAIAEGNDKQQEAIMGQLRELVGPYFSDELAQLESNDEKTKATILYLSKIDADFKQEFSAFFSKNEETVDIESVMNQIDLLIKFSAIVSQLWDYYKIHNRDYYSLYAERKTWLFNDERIKNADYWMQGFCKSYRFSMTCEFQPNGSVECFFLSDDTKADYKKSPSNCVEAQKEGGKE